MFNKEYKFDLYSITPNIIVNRDWSKRGNIYNADKKIVMEILATPTFRKSFYKEIITGIPIPVYRMHFRFKHETEFCTDESADYYSIPSFPCFIKIREYNVPLIDSGNNLKTASADDVKEYLERYSSNLDALKKELNEIFQKAEEYYEQAYKKGDYSDEYKVKSLLKNMRRR